MNENNNKEEIPIWRKYTLTIEETALYTNIGVHTLRNLIKDLERKGGCDFVLNIGVKKLIKRQKFEDYINKVSVI